MTAKVFEADFVLFLVLLKVADMNNKLNRSQ